jgi:CRISPR/Cas system-associated exonuclease Cas4 (RecB family)
MDFIFIKDDKIHIIDWKTGKKDEKKHTKQLLAYALAVKGLNPTVKSEEILPKSVYVNGIYEELSPDITDEKLTNVADTIMSQTQEMQKFCLNIKENVPLSIENFYKTSNETICKMCEFQELCMN